MVLQEAKKKVRRRHTVTLEFVDWIQAPTPRGFESIWSVRRIQHLDLRAKKD